MHQIVCCRQAAPPFKRELCSHANEAQERKKVETIKSSFSIQQVLKIVFKYVYLIITLYLMNFIFEQAIIQLSVKYRIESFLNNGWNKINLNRSILITTITFALVYVFFDILFFIRKNKLLKLCSLFFDLLLLVSAVLYFIQMLIAMSEDPGEAGFGFILLLFSVFISTYSIYSIVSKLKHWVSLNQPQ